MRGQQLQRAPTSGQILINNKGSRFLDSGDSGSLMVEDVAVNPRAVGLLYAGSSSVAIANPINDVLDYFGVIDGRRRRIGGQSTRSGVRTGQQAARSPRRSPCRSGTRVSCCNVPGAVGHAVGAGNSPVIKILVQEITPRAQAAAPRQLEGVPVILEEVGDVKGMPFCSKRSRLTRLPAIVQIYWFE